MGQVHGTKWRVMFLTKNIYKERIKESRHHFLPFKKIHGVVVIRSKIFVKFSTASWGFSSVGRARAQHARGHRFNSDILHGHYYIQYAFEYLATFHPRTNYPIIVQYTSTLIPNATYPSYINNMTILPIYSAPGHHEKVCHMKKV